MNTSFSIKDLENICGIKAHTIRIWEKRYGLLTPERTDTNIRTYNMESLKKLLNVSFLVNCGYKISRISKLTPEEVDEYLKSIVSDQTIVDKTFNNMKLAMLNYSNHLFQETLNEARLRFSFNEIFHNILIPFLNEIGMLWQSNTIDSSHEHFITSLIKQNLWSQINDQQNNNKNTGKTYVLFLPLGEINDLCLIFLNNLLLEKGYRTIFLGANISIENLKDLSELQDDLIFLSYFTIAPHANDVNEYLTKFKEKICAPNNHELWAMGHILNEVQIPIDTKIKIIYSFEDFEHLTDL